jgi:transposase
MQAAVKTIGLDIAKSVFQVHGVDAEGQVAVARACVAALGVQLRALKAQILEFDRQIMLWHRSHETSKRLDEIPGVGPALATALVASIADPKAFRSGTRLLGLDCVGAEAAFERGAKRNSAVSASKVIATCAACSRQARLP